MSRGWTLTAAPLIAPSDTSRSRAPHVRSETQRRLGVLYNGNDYPSTLDGLFDMEWSVVPIEPSHYLVALSPELFQQEPAPVP